MPRSKSGFTIIELLIVIVVIAILAAITIVAYNGMQANARNASRIAAAKDAYKLMVMYGTQYGSYPPLSDSVCIGSGYQDVSGDGIGDCWTQNTNSYRGIESTTFNNELRKIGSLPSPDKTQVSWPNGGGWTRGVTIGYWTSLTVNGQSKPYRIWYNLEGGNKDCGMNNVIIANGSPNYTHTTRNTDYDGSTTTCQVTLPNPSGL